VNDISAGEDDPMMLDMVGRLGLEYIAMHKRGNSALMQSMTDYEDVTEAVKNYFEAFSVKAENAGIRTWVLDPGFGFAKTVSQNYQMMRNLRRFRRPYSSCERPKILVGVSRKSMIYKPLDITAEEALPQTQVLHLKALQEGADMLRVHDVAEAKRTVEVYWRLC
jgi:dihydropteroate synthase